jgi:hypothetical protein
LCYSFTTVVIAQTNKGSSAKSEMDSTFESHSYFKLSLNYLSNSIYYGRKDSTVSPYITPAIRYANKSGFYAEASVSYLPVSKQSRIDIGTVGAGYIFYNKDSTLETEFYANKYFTNSNGNSVKSALKADMGANVSYDADFLIITGEVYGIFSTKADITTGLSFARYFELDNNDEWSFAPTVTINAGTNNFYKTYFTDIKYAPRRRTILSGEPFIKPIIIKKGFGILDYEVSTPIKYEGEKYGFYFTPTYTIPVNPVSFSINNGLTYRTEKLTNSFYGEVGFYIKLW